LKKAPSGRVDGTHEVLSLWAAMSGGGGM